MKKGRLYKFRIYRDKFSGNYLAIDHVNIEAMSLYYDNNQKLEIAPQELYIDGYYTIIEMPSGMIKVDNARKVKINVRDLINTRMTISK